MKKYFIALLFSVFLISCSNEEEFLTNEPQNGNEQTNQNSITVKDGYLNFDSDATLKDYLASLQTNQITTRSSKLKIEGFTSIADLKNSLVSTRSTGNDEDEEEMSTDEFNIMRAEELVVDPILREVMDTTLRIGVADRVYKITDYGTFSAPTEKASSIDKAIAEFDKTLIDRNETGAYVTLKNDVVFTNSFGKPNTEAELEEITEPAEETPSLRSTAAFVGTLQDGYNTNTYKWANNSVWQKFWDMIRGKDVTKENNFSKDRRVQVNVFNVNYAFYASSGIKVKMQKRRKFLFVTYWSEIDADKMAIGFNKVYGEMKYTNPRSYSTLTPTNANYWGAFTGTLNGQASKFLYGQYKQFDLIKDWGDEIFMFVPEIEIKNNIFPNQSMINKVYMAPADEVFSFLKGQANKWVYEPIRKQIQPKDPRMSYLVWGSTTTTFNEDKSYVYGVQEYGRRSSKTVRFDQSFGFNLNNKSISGFVPTEFKINDIDAFGAAYYNNQWRGVRFVK